jgi:hypothetical protein
MKKSSGAIETHNLRQQRYPLPGTDLGSVNARPAEFVADVDLNPCGHSEGRCTCGHEGHHYEYEDGHGGHIGQHTFAVPKYAKKFDWEK